MMWIALAMPSRTSTSASRNGGTPFSHIVTVKTEVRDHAAVAAACRRLALPEPVQGSPQLYSGQASGLLGPLPHWLYPVVIETATGTMRYDNYGGSWGDEQHLHRLLQAYTVERARSEAR